MHVFVFQLLMTDHRNAHTGYAQQPSSCHIIKKQDVASALRMWREKESHAEVLAQQLY